MASSLAELPVDILHLIFPLLPQADLASLCLVTRHFRPLVEPLLYETLDWTLVTTKFESHVQPMYSREAMDQMQPPKSHPPILSLLRTIISRPHLASLIHNVKIRGRSNRRLVDVPMDDVDVELLIPLVDITGVSPSHHDAWIRALRKGSIDGLIALLLSQLPNLKHLVLGEFMVSRWNLVGKLVLSATCEDPSSRLRAPCRDFPRLATVEYGYTQPETPPQPWHDHNWHYYSSMDILPFFYLPNVRSISATMDNPAQRGAWYGKVFPWPDLEPRMASSLRCLSVKVLREDSLLRVLEVTPRLEKLSWEWYQIGGPSDSSIGNSRIELDRIAMAMAHTRDTLTELTITARNVQGVGDSDRMQLHIDQSQSLRGVTALHKLVKLEAPLVFLAASWHPPSTCPLAQCLPRSLKSLTITRDLWYQDDYGWDDYEPYDYHCWTAEVVDRHLIAAVIFRFLETWQEVTPNLREICLDDWDCLHGLYGPCLTEFGATQGLLIRFNAHVVCEACIVNAEEPPYEGPLGSNVGQEPDVLSNNVSGPEIW